MKEFSQEAEQVMIERFGKDTIISLETTENTTPYVRYVNAYYENGAFYVITHALSNKMKHIKITLLLQSPASGLQHTGMASVWVISGKRELCDCREAKKVFAEWIDNGHTDFNDENTIILQVELSDGLLLSHGTRYEF